MSAALISYAPWTDRAGRTSWLKLVCFLGCIAPALSTRSSTACAAATQTANATRTRRIRFTRTAPYSTPAETKVALPAGVASSFNTARDASPAVAPFMTTAS